MENQTDNNQMMALVKEWAQVILSALVIAFIIHTFILSSTIIEGDSMNPTLEHSDRLLVDKVSVHFDRYSRGDIIEFHAPDRDGDYIKRIIALPGDTVEIIANEVYVNEEKIVEDYTSSNETLVTRDQSRWLIEEGQIFVLGDNRLPGASYDSRSFGTIDMESVVGIAFFRYTPLSRFGKLR